MNNIRKVLWSAALAGFVVSVAGCDATVTAQSADWYKEHGAERGAMLAKCDANPGQLGETADCLNAKAAQAAVTWQAKQGVEGVAPVKFGAPASAGTSGRP
jgi:hypothetical protein